MLVSLFTSESVCFSESVHLSTSGLYQDDFKICPLPLCDLCIEEEGFAGPFPRHAGCQRFLWALQFLSFLVSRKGSWGQPVCGLLPAAESLTFSSPRLDRWTGRNRARGWASSVGWAMLAGVCVCVCVVLAGGEGWPGDSDLAADFGTEGGSGFPLVLGCGV